MRRIKNVAGLPFRAVRKGWSGGVGSKLLTAVLILILLGLLFEGFKWLAGVV